MLKKLALLSLLLLPFAGAQAEVDEKLYNPQPADDDVVVSMPCDVKMIFRKVYTSNGKELMRDHRFSAGNPETESPISQSPNFRYIQGGLHDDQGYYFLMAKYEMTELQYRALMDEKCPEPNRKMRLPMVNISWFDALEAGHRYSLYLAASSDAPKSGETPAFARLPTDSEFEFAVRGGLSVGQAQFDANTFVSEGELKDYAWHSGSSSANGKLSPIGVLKPNPLGICDLLGNAQEMIFDPYAATRSGRMHGMSGGFCVRGGSFLTPASEMTSAARTEKSFYVNGKDLTARDIGMRLVLNVPVTTGDTSTDELKQQIERLSADDGSNDAASIAKLNEIIKKNKEITEQNKAMSEQNKQTEAQVSELENRIAELASSLNVLQVDMVKAKDERDEMQRRAMSNNLRVGGMLCLNVAESREDRIVIENFLANIKGNADSAAMKEMLKDAVDEQLHNLATAQKIEDFFTDFMLDHVAETLGLYEVKDLQAELPSAMQVVKTNEVNNISKYTEMYLTVLKEYKSRTDLQQNKQMLSDKCYSIIEAVSK